MAKYYCILLDADNTVLDFDAAENKALTETLIEFGIEPDNETMQKYREINTALWQQLERGQIRREKLRSERFSRFLKEINAAGNPAEMNKVYLEHLACHSDSVSGMKDVLHELSEVATLAVVTNGFEAVQSRRLAGAGVTDYLEGVFVSEKYDCEKPNRKLFDVAIRTLGIENREHILVVGDGLSSDIQGGINAGLDTCWFNPNHKENTSKLKPTYEIDKPEQLYSLVMEPDELENVGNRNRRHMTV